MAQHSLNDNILKTNKDTRLIFNRNLYKRKKEKGAQMFTVLSKK